MLRARAWAGELQQRWVPVGGVGAGGTRPCSMVVFGGRTSRCARDHAHCAGDRRDDLRHCVHERANRRLQGRHGCENGGS